MLIFRRLTFSELHSNIALPLPLPLWATVTARQSIVVTQLLVAPIKSKAAVGAAQGLSKIISQGDMIHEILID